MSRHVRLYGRQGCHLCDEAEALLTRLASRVGITIEKVDIESDPALEYRYRWAIPVVEVDGEELARAPIRAGALEDALRERLAQGTLAPTPAADHGPSSEGRP